MAEDPDEPDIRDLVEGLLDFFLSITLFNVLHRKLEVRSYREFFNRAIGIGLILTAVGILSLFLSWAFGSGTSLNIFGYDLRGPITFLVSIGILWFLSTVIRQVNIGIAIDDFLGDYFGGSTTDDISPSRKFIVEAVTAVVSGAALYIALNELRFGRQSIIEAMLDVLLLGTVFGVFLFIIGYFLRSLFGVFGILRAKYQRRKSVDSEETPQELG